MEFNVCISFIFIVTLSFIFTGLECRTFQRKVAEEKIKSSNSIRTATTIYGHTYECVDIFEQPSLKDPALKGQKIQLEKLMAKYPPKKGKKKDSIWLKEGCPFGTVPIRQNLKEHTDGSLYASNLSSLGGANGILDFAGIRTKPIPGATYTSTLAVIDVYNPHVQDGSEQFSAASVIVESGNANTLNQIQVGWMVNPKLYGDQSTRLYIAWTADNYQNTGCFNTFCPGFIQYSNDIPLDYIFPHISEVDGEQVDTQFYLNLKYPMGWEFYFNFPPELVGYWPSTLFPTLQEHAEQVRWGGQVFTPSTDEVSPPMGSGLFYNGQWSRTCYMRQLSVVNDSGPFIPDNSFIDQADSRCYYGGGNSYIDDMYWQYRFLFGGKGGKDEVTCLY